MLNKQSDSIRAKLVTYFTFYIVSIALAFYLLLMPQFCRIFFGKYFRVLEFSQYLISIQSINKCIQILT